MGQIITVKEICVMNRKQLAIMWIGIAAIIFWDLLAMHVDEALTYPAVLTIIVAVTIGLVVSLADEKPKDKSMDSRFRGNDTENKSA